MKLNISLYDTGPAMVSGIMTGHLAAVPLLEWPADLFSNEASEAEIMIDDVFPWQGILLAILGDMTRAGAG